MSDDRMTISRTDVLIVATSYPPAILGGGPAQTILALAQAAPGRFDIQIVAPSVDLDGTRLDVHPDQWRAEGSVRVLYFSGWRALLNEVRRAGSRDSQIIYLNSFFSLKMSLIPLLILRLTRSSSSILIAPRGEFDPGALKIRRLKKKVYIACYRGLGLHRRPIWHASSQLEAENIRRSLGGRANVLIRENETLLSKQPVPIRHRSDDSRFRLAYLGRLVPKKGLHVALEALRDVSDRSDFIVDIYGPAEDGVYVRRCLELARHAPMNVEIAFRGAVEHADVVTTLCNYDAFILPTAGENFGHVIAESLAAGCPVLISDSTPWSSLVRTERAGRVIEPNTPSAWRTVFESIAADGSERWRAANRPSEAFEAWQDIDKGPHIFAQVAARIRLAG